MWRVPRWQVSRFQFKVNDQRPAAPLPAILLLRRWASSILKTAGDNMPRKLVIPDERGYKVAKKGAARLAQLSQLGAF